MENKDILQFWEKQAALSEKAGSRDLIAKKNEISALARHLRDGISVCEFGCGNGVTAIEFARRFDVTLDCFDFSAAMIEAARADAETAGVAGKIRFAVADVQSEPALERQYDLIYTERMVINVQGWEAQERAIRYLARNVKPGGRLVLCENSIDGLGKLNELRKCAGLPAIQPPWHNCYLSDGLMAELKIPGLQLTAVEPFSATYYFLSRVVNAWLAKHEGREPAYDAPVNALALELPPYGDCAQGKLWVFDKQ